MKGRKNFPAPVATASINFKVAGKDGTFDVMNIRISKAELTKLPLDKNGNYKLKGYIKIGKDKETGEETPLARYAYLSEDTFVPKAKAGGSASSKVEDDGDLPF